MVFPKLPEYFYNECSPLGSEDNNMESPISVYDSSENLIVASCANGRLTLKV